MPRLTLLAIVAALLTAEAVRAADELFLAVGYGGRRMVSTDGLHWEITAEWSQPGGDDGDNLMSAVYAEGKFVVTGGGGGGNSGDGHILTSVDGRDWTEVYQGKNRINPVVHGAGRFVVGAPSRRLLWSDDAETWHEGPQIDDKLCTHFRGGAYGNDRFVFVGNHGGNGGPHWVAVSPDGTSITGVRTDLPGHGPIVFGASRFLMLVTRDDVAELLASTDGLDWRAVAVAPEQTGAAAKLAGLVRTDDAFFVTVGKSIYRSTDGLAWTKTDLAPPRGTLKWTDGTRGIASAWPGKMSFTADGKKWQDSPPMTANGINRVVRRLKE